MTKKEENRKIDVCSRCTCRLSQFTDMFTQCCQLTHHWLQSLGSPKYECYYYYYYYFQLMHCSLQGLLCNLD
jgi:hypothetical protein